MPHVSDRYVDASGRRRPGCPFVVIRLVLAIVDRQVSGYIYWNCGRSNRKLRYVFRTRAQEGAVELQVEPLKWKKAKRYGIQNEKVPLFDYESGDSGSTSRAVIVP